MTSRKEKKKTTSRLNKSDFCGKDEQQEIITTYKKRKGGQYVQDDNRRCVQ
jgi:hypothetical protein